MNRFSGRGRASVRMFKNINRKGAERDASSMIYPATVFLMFVCVMH